MHFPSKYYRRLYYINVYVIRLCYTYILSEGHPVVALLDILFIVVKWLRFGRILLVVELLNLSWEKIKKKKRFMKQRFIPICRYDTNYSWYNSQEERSFWRFIPHIWSIFTGFKHHHANCRLKQFEQCLRRNFELTWQHFNKSQYAAKKANETSWNLSFAIQTCIIY